MDGFDLIAELDTNGAVQLVRAYWKSQAATSDFAALEAVREASVRIWPKLESPTEPIQNGLVGYVRFAATRQNFGANDLGLPSEQAVDMSLYASDRAHLHARLVTSISLDVRVELQYPGPFGPYRKAADSLYTTARVIVFADAAISRGDVPDVGDCLFLDPMALRVSAIHFLGTPPPPELIELLNNLVAELLPFVAGRKPIPLSPLIASLSKGRHIQPTSPCIVFRSFHRDTGEDLTARQLTGDARFEAVVRTIISIGVGFGFAGSPHRRPLDEAAFDARSRRLRSPAYRAEHMAMSVSSWVFTYLERYHIERQVRTAFNQYFIGKNHEAPQNPDQPLRHRCDRGWAMIKVYDKHQAFTEDGDDGVIVIQRCRDLAIAGGRLHASLDFYQIQKGLFDIDVFQPDIDMEAGVRIGLKANSDQSSIESRAKLIPDALFLFKRKDSVFEQIVGAILSVQDLFKAAFNAITGDFEQAKYNLIDFAVNIFVSVAIPLWNLLNLLNPDLSKKLLNDPVDVPAFDFADSEKVSFGFATDPIADAPRPGDVHDAGLVMFARLELKS